jgi:hypothetical protein
MNLSTRVSLPLVKGENVTEQSHKPFINAQQTDGGQVRAEVQPPQSNTSVAPCNAVTTMTVGILILTTFLDCFAFGR